MFIQGSCIEYGLTHQIRDIKTIMILKRGRGKKKLQASSSTHCIFYFIVEIHNVSVPHDLQ